MRRYFKRFSLILFSLAVLTPLFLLGHVRFHSSRSRLPERGEEIRRLGGLEEEVKVAIDDRGIPHLEALAEGDLWFAQGYLHARDRFFHMELARKTAEGRLAEILGDSAVASDRTMRVLRISAIARRQASELSDGNRRILERYVAGVNGALEEFGRWISPETWILGIDSEPWRVEHSLAIFLLHHLDGSRAMDVELRRSAELAHYGRAEALNLWGWSPRQARQWIPPVDMPAQELNGFEWPVPSVSGVSSAWAIAPGRSFSGNALVAGVLGKATTLPGGWYAIGLRAPGLHAAGASLVGVPGILVGHNDKVAWMVAESRIDDQDVFVATLDEAGTRELVDGGWIPVRTVTEELVIRWRTDPEILKVKISRHGPIISERVDRSLALAWTAIEAKSSVQPYLQMIRCESVADAAEVWRDSTWPALNLVAADIQGHLVHQIVGGAPARGRGAGRLPAPGSDSSWAWDGVRPFSDNPRVVDPSYGFVAAAGHDPFVEGDFSGSWEFPGEFDSPWRARRLRDVLGRRSDWKVEDCLVLQGDILSGRAVVILKALWPDFEKHGGPTAKALLGWDGRLDSDRLEPHLYARLMIELSKEVGIDEARDAGRQFSAVDDDRILGLLGGAIGDHWWDDVRTERREGRQDIVGRCLDRLDAIGLRASWGEVHTMTYHHRLAGLPVIGRLFRGLGDWGPYPVGGDETTINGTAWKSETPFEVETAGSLRFAVDVGDWDGSVLALPIGQSGRLWSTHSGDQVADWMAGRGERLPYSREAIARAARVRLRLKPGEKG